MKTKKKATGNHSIISLKKLCQFTDNKKQESVERHNPLHPEETWHFEKSFQQKNEKKRIEFKTGNYDRLQFFIQLHNENSHWQNIENVVTCDDYLNLLFLK